MLIETAKKLFNKDLNKLKEEISSYRNESNLWIIDKDISNCAGNLCLHLVGNLKHFIGAELGSTGYVRQRELEFSLKNVPRADMLRQIDETMIVVEQTLSKLAPEDLQKEYRRRVSEDYMTTGYFIMHLTSHLAYHLGQINYHRRLLDA